MSAWEQHEQGAGWQALSGDAQHGVPPQQPAQPQQPIYGGWQQAWQDETGQWHYPFGAQQPQDLQPPYPAAAHQVAEVQPTWQDVVPPAPQHAPAPPVEQTIVQQHELAPVGPPRYAAPVRVAQDPRQRTMAAVITFVALIVTLWAILGFMGSLSKTLSSIAGGNAKLEQQLHTANEGLVKLDHKTHNLHAMADDSKRLNTSLVTIDKDMGEMLKGVDIIASSMTAMDGSLGTLQTELGSVNEINTGMADKLGTINTGLQQQVKSVRTMRRDVQATGDVLTTLPGRLNATNNRLMFVNNAVNIMGCRGITNNLKVSIFAGPLKTGSAEVFATVAPPGAWGTLPDGTTPCPAGVAR